MTIGFGIVSYLPDDAQARQMRVERLNRLLRQIDELWPGAPILIVAQNWQEYDAPQVSSNPITIFRYAKLGILKARQTLRRHFLNDTTWDYIVLCDDDCIVQCDTDTAAQEYMQTVAAHPNGFCFIPGPGDSNYNNYADSQLNLCAISRYIFQREPMPLCDVDKDGAFEDRIFAELLHVKYHNREFIPPSTIRHIHFRNPNEPAPSTWARAKRHDWKHMCALTAQLELFIVKYGDLPKHWRDKEQ